MGLGLTENKLARITRFCSSSVFPFEKISSCGTPNDSYCSAQVANQVCSTDGLSSVNEMVGVDLSNVPGSGGGLALVSAAGSGFLSE
jgi:hypothetical protein